MIRYFYSFCLTSFLYALCIGGFFYIFSKQKLNLEEKPSLKKVALNHITLIEKKEEKYQEKKIGKQEISKKKQKINKKTSKKVIKEKQKKKKSKKIIKKAVQKKEIETKKTTEKIVEVTKKNEVKKLLSSTTKNINSTKKSVEITSNVDYENLIKEQIEKHIIYPKRAKKMKIQGEVKVKFIILSNGSIKDVEALSGHRLLRKSTINAIYEASKFFPKVKKDLTITIPIIYNLIHQN